MEGKKIQTDNVQKIETKITDKQENLQNSGRRKFLNNVWKYILAFYGGWWAEIGINYINENINEKRKGDSIRDLIEFPAVYEDKTVRVYGYATLGNDEIRGYPDHFTLYDFTTSKQVKVHIDDMCTEESLDDLTTQLNKTGPNHFLTVRVVGKYHRNSDNREWEIDLDKLEVYKGDNKRVIKITKI
jgi:hypothetical protein